MIALAPLLTIPREPESGTAHVRLPRVADNLFERLIRDPQAPSRPMRERQCTEMLRAVLVNCPALSDAVYRWLADQFRIQPDVLAGMRWIVETEGAIGAKRDDLRIEGWREADGDEQCFILWTIEVGRNRWSTPLGGGVGW